MMSIAQVRSAGSAGIAGISKDDGLVTLQDAEGNTRLISPREAVAEGVTLYTPDKIRVGGDCPVRILSGRLSLV